jgi:hypothetical protein
VISSFTHPGRIPTANFGAEDALRRWPRLTAHLIAESLGYFTPEGAASALPLFKRDQENWCEWFLHMAALKRKPILQVAAETIRRAICQRRYHRGYMGSYEFALKIVRQRIATGRGPMFTSWFDVCRQLRADLDVPVIMLTARDDVEDKVHALDLGVDDYVSKPFAFDELVARVRAVLRRRMGGVAEHLVFANLECDLSTRDVRRGSRTLALTPREFDLLVHFLRHTRHVLTRDAVLQAVWGHELADTKVVDGYIG